MTGLEALDDGDYTAVIDTIEDGFATVFFEQDGEEVGSAVIDAELLCTDACHADAILCIKVVDSEIVAMEYDPDHTATRKQSAQDRFNRLSSRPPGDDDST